jgi:heptosyltransferase-2
VKRVAVIAPRDAEEARAAVPALRALSESPEGLEVEVYAMDEAADALRALEVSSTPLVGGLGSALRALAPDAVVLMDPEEEDAVAARDAGVELRVGWGPRLGALTHAVQPARLHGRDHRPLPSRAYLDVVGLLGTLPISALPELSPKLPEGKVLLRLPNWLGDVVQCEPLLRAFSGSAERLTLVGPRALQPLFSDVIAGATWLSRGAGARAWRGNDLALLLDGSMRSAWRAALAGIPKRVSWARGGKSLFLTDAVRPPRELGAPAVGCGRPGSNPRWLPRPFEVSVAELASAAGVVLQGERPRLSAGEEGRRAAEILMGESGISDGERFVLAAVGGRPGSAKAVPIETWGATLEAIRAKTRVPVLLTCGPGEEERLGSLVERGLPEGVRCVRGGATELRVLLGLLEEAAAFVTADSGPRHLAAAAGCPSVVLHGPTDPRHSGVTGGRIRVSRLWVSCGPCHRERCPLTGSEHLACFGEGHAESAAAMLCEVLAPEALEMKT